MMTTKWRVAGMAIAALVGFGAPALADSVAVGQTLWISNPGDPSRFHYPIPGTTPQAFSRGGPFDAHAQDGSVFQTFCLERGAGISFNTNYTVESLTDAAKSGGLGGREPDPADGTRDPLDDMTRWAYHYFRNPDIAPATTVGGRTVNWSDGMAIQEAIWFIEFEIPQPGQDRNQYPWVSQNASDIYTAVSLFGAYTGSSNVRVMRLSCQPGNTVNDCSDLQDLLTIQDPVPEPASLMLLGSGLLGLAAWRRKKAVQ